MIVDVERRGLGAWSFNYTEVEKKTELVAGVFGEGERAASKKPALHTGFAAQGWSFGVFGRSFGCFYRPVLPKVADFFSSLQRSAYWHNESPL